MKYVIDSYAWLEYFMGTVAGEKAKKIIESVAYEKLTPTICLAEIYVKVLRVEGTEKAELQRAFIKSRSALVPLTEEIAIEAAKIDVEMKKKIAGWGLADSIVLGTARKKKAKVLTGDEHFLNLPETAYIE
ncbi:MAG: type II toxin-antitoxin system VapC family toxin [Candidatus Bathyarchaeia archaeon]